MIGGIVGGGVEVGLIGDIIGVCGPLGAGMPNEGIKMPGFGISDGGVVLIEEGPNAIPGRGGGSSGMIETSTVPHWTATTTWEGWHFAHSYEVAAEGFGGVGGDEEEGAVVFGVFPGVFDGGAGLADAAHAVDGVLAFDDDGAVERMNYEGRMMKGSEILHSYFFDRTSNGR